jgi:hypothetical protein
LKLTDCIVATSIESVVLELNGEKFITPQNPYSAMYVLDRDLVYDYIAMDSFDSERSKTRIGWPSTERAAMGMMFENIPAGRVCRNVVPIDQDSGRPLFASFIHHLPNNFTNGEMLTEKFPFGSVKIQEGFINF